MAGNVNDEKEILKNLVGQIRDIYVDIIKLRNEDRNKYKEMCARLDAIEKDRSFRTQRKRRGTKHKNKKGSQLKNASGTGNDTKSYNDEDKQE